MPETGIFKKVRPYYSKNGNIKDWFIEVECKCGKIYTPILDNYKRGKSRTCGCEQGLIRHRMARTKIYKIWCTMKQRCKNVNDKNYKYYGGRGIDICEDWLSFETFYRDMGAPVDKGWSIDRIDNNKGYNPENCWWALISQQNNNHRNNVIIPGTKMTATDYARSKGWPPGLILHRINSLKWDMNKAISTPWKKRGPYRTKLK